MRKAGGRAVHAGDEAAVLQQKGLQLVHILFRHVGGQAAAGNRHSRAGAACLTDDRAGAHHARGAHGHVRRADVAAGKHQVGHVDRVQAAEGNLIRRLGLDVVRGIAHEFEAQRVMVVHRPAAVGNGVGEGVAFLQIALVEHVRALVAAALALAGQEADPLDLPVLHAVVALILDVVPHAVGNAQQFLIDGLRVADGIGFRLAAQLDPPEVHARADDVVILQVHALVVGIGVRPFRLDEGTRMIRLTGLDEDGRAHGSGIRRLRCAVLVKFSLTLASHAELRAGQGRQDAVAGCVDEQLCLHRVEGVAVQLPAGHGGDPAVRHLNAEAGGVQKQRQVGLVHGHLIKHRIPHGVVHRGIAVDVLHFGFHQQARFAVFLAGHHRAAHPHAHLAGGVAAQHGAVLHQQHLRAVARRRNGCVQAGKAAAHHAHVRLMMHLVFREIHR